VAGSVRDGLTPEALARVAEAISRAEAGTAGEIVVMLSARASRYRSIPPVAALVGVLLAPWPLIALTQWGPVRILLVQAALAAAILALGLREGLRVALVPRPLRRARAREAALRAFRARGLTRTRGHTGVLLYLALSERHAEVVADEGILRRIPANAWDGILADLLAALARGGAEGGLTRAVAQLGARLAAEFPAGPDDPDELPNRVIVTD
jgi:putative membrane protein